MIPIFVAIIILLIISPLFRTIVNNFHLIGIYSIVDLYNYIRFKKWLDWNYNGIDMFVGMFGHGKTLCMTHKARLLYKRYGDRIRFLSNYKLNDIPYIPLINFQQIVDLSEEEETDYIGTVVLIDEIGHVLNNRNFAKFPLALLSTILQQRKLGVYILCSCQRYFMTDKLWRSITTSVYNCNKFWRFQHIEQYDAWDYENAMNYRDIKRIGNYWFFVKNQDYNSYNTKEIITKNAQSDFISNDESLMRIGEVYQNSGAVTNRSKKIIKQEKKMNKK